MSPLLCWKQVLYPRFQAVFASSKVPTRIRTHNLVVEGSYLILLSEYLIITLPLCQALRMEQVANTASHLPRPVRFGIRFESSETWEPPAICREDNLTSVKPARSL